MRAGPSSTSRKHGRFGETGQLTPPARNKAVYRLLLSASGNKASPRKLLPRVLAQSSPRWAIVKSATRDPGSVCFCVASLMMARLRIAARQRTEQGAHHLSQADRPSQLSGMPGFCCQLGRTSRRLPPHLLHLALAC